MTSVMEPDVAQVDPNSLHPEQQLKKKKKKKKKKTENLEDPFKDVEDRLYDTAIVEDPHMENVDIAVVVKIEDIEVSVDCSEIMNDQGMMIDQTSLDGGIQDPNRISLDSDDYPLKHDLLPIEASPTYICDVCNLVFSNATTLRIHKTRKHDAFKNELKFSCIHCDMAYEKKQSLVVHVRRKHGKAATPDDKEERVCNICSLVFIGMGRLKMHMQRKHGSFMADFTHSCPYCGLMYDKYTSLCAHMQRKHTDKEKVNEIFNCPFCPKFFTVRESLKTHVKRKHRVSEGNNIDYEFQSNLTENGDYICSYCPLTFSNIPTLKMHMQRTHDAYGDRFHYKCTVCNLSYDKLTSLKRHIKRKHDKTAYCDTCQKQFDTFEMYLNHVHHKQGIECEQCAMIFPNARSHKKHVTEKHESITLDILPEPTIFCDQCSTGFPNKRLLRHHMNKVHTAFTCQCTVCNKSFKSKDSLRNHIARKHVSQMTVKERICPHCDKRFDHEREYCNHVLEHANQIQNGQYQTSDVNLYLCTKCSESFPNWELLQLHYNTAHGYNLENKSAIESQAHTLANGELDSEMTTVDPATENLKCDHCDYEASHRVNLTKHLLRHIDLTPLKCDAEDCNYSTFNKLVFDKHKLKHSSQIDKYQCSKCPFQSTNKYVLTYHERQHFTEEKCFKCGECDYTTSAQANLFQHKYKHYPEKKFKCEECSFATKYNTSLRFHIKTHHCDLPVVSK